MIFDYPDQRIERIHGPEGYRRTASFRPWLRDEFTFRCVYCLKRETWGQTTGEFELDHFQPQSLAPDRKLSYANLVYACRRCNAVKLDQQTDDPMTILSSKFVTLHQDGTLATDDARASRVIKQLDLNAPELKKWRVMWLRIVSLAAERDRVLLRRLTGFPYDLPNLTKLRPPRNARPDGVELSWCAKQARGQLPDDY